MRQMTYIYGVFSELAECPSFLRMAGQAHDVFNWLKT